MSQLFFLRQHTHACVASRTERGANYIVLALLSCKVNTA